VGAGIAIGGIALGSGSLALYQAPQASADGDGGTSGASCGIIQILGNCGAGNVGGNGITAQNNQVNLQLGLSNISAQSVRTSGNSSAGYGNANVAGGGGPTPSLLQLGGNRGAGNTGGSLLTAQNNQLGVQLGLDNRSLQSLTKSGNSSAGFGNLNFG
jgi:hypothetical protein